MSTEFKFVAFCTIGVIFTLAGHFGPEDGGLLQLIGLGLVAWAFILFM